MDCSRRHLLNQPQPLLLRCPHCDRPLGLEDLHRGARLSDPMTHALIDHLLLVETELAAIRRLIMEEVLL